MRLSAGLSEGPLGTAHETSTPSSSRRKSQCILRAECCWITNSSGPVPVPFAGGGSGVAAKVRLAEYCSSARSAEADFAVVFRLAGPLPDLRSPAAMFQSPLSPRETAEG